jgi:antitoxin PrlF
MPATVTAKGQITLPKKLREAAGIKPGDRVDVKLDRENRLIVSGVQNDDLLRRSEIEARIRKAAEIARAHLVEPGMTSDEFMELMRGDD